MIVLHVDELFILHNGIVTTALDCLIGLKFLICHAKMTKTKVTFTIEKPCCGSAGKEKTAFKDEAVFSGSDGTSILSRGSLYQDIGRQARGVIGWP